MSARGQAPRYLRLLLRDAEAAAQTIGPPDARQLAFGGLVLVRQVQAKPADVASRTGAGERGRALLARPDAQPKTAIRWLGTYLVHVGELPS